MIIKQVLLPNVDKSSLSLLVLEEGDITVNMEVSQIIILFNLHCVVDSVHTEIAAAVS